jgi:hypothetical protein
MSRWTKWNEWWRLVNIRPRTRNITKEQIDAGLRWIQEAEEVTWEHLVRAALPEPPEPPELKRWKLVRKLHFTDRLSWPKAYRRASKELAGTDAAGSWSTMKGSYVKVEKLHRDEQKRRQE